MRVKERNESVCCLMPSFIFPAGSTAYRSLLDLKVRNRRKSCAFLFQLIILVKSKAPCLLSLLYVDFYYEVKSGNMNSHCLFGHGVLSIALLDTNVLIYLKSLLRHSSFVLLLLGPSFYSVVPLNSIHRYSTFFFYFMYLKSFL